MSSVLVVDDSKTQRIVIDSYLRPLGCEVETCNSGQQALTQISQSVPDVIILDVEMEGLSGYETCQAIRGYLQEHWVPIIYLTGRSSPESMVEGLEAGGDAYIAKPVNDQVLRAIVKAMLRISDVQQQLIEANKKLDEIAFFDVLTKIMNRRGYEEMYQRLWDNHQRRRQPISALLMDIDHFKQYNDNYGHIEGDKCLREVAQAIKETLKRPIDVVARYGGEEFVVVLPDTDEEGALAVAKKIIETMATLAIPHAHSSAAEHVTVSIGIATSIDSTQHELNADQLIQKADEALYQAKESGRNKAACAKIA